MIDRDWENGLLILGQKSCRLPATFCTFRCQEGCRLPATKNVVDFLLPFAPLGAKNVVNSKAGLPNWDRSHFGNERE